MSIIKILLKNNFKGSINNQVRQSYYVKDIKRISNKFNLDNIGSYWNKDITGVYTLFECKSIEDWELFIKSKEYIHVKTTYKDVLNSENIDYLYKTSNIDEMFLL